VVQRCVLVRGGVRARFGWSPGHGWVALCAALCLVSADAVAEPGPEAAPAPTPLEQLFAPYVDRVYTIPDRSSVESEQVVLARLTREVSGQGEASSEPARWEIVVERVYEGDFAAKQVHEIAMDCGREGALVAGERWIMMLGLEEGRYHCWRRAELENDNFWGLTSSFAGVLASRQEAHPALREAETIESKQIKALSADIGKMRCELPERFRTRMILWPDGRRERFVQRDHRDAALNRGLARQRGVRMAAEPLSEAASACLGEALEGSRGPRFKGRAVVLNLLASREGAARLDVKAWRWSSCDAECAEGELLWPPYEDVLSDAMFVALIERDLRPALPTIGHGAMRARPGSSIDLFAQTCLLRGEAAMRALDLSLPRSAQGWQRIQQMLCAARWGEHGEVRDSSPLLLKDAASVEGLNLLKTLSRWDGGDEASLLHAWREQAGFASRAEVYAMLSRRQSLMLEFSPWLLHARGFLLERINPARHDEAVALVMLAARLSKGSTAARYEQIAAQMGVTPRSVTLLNAWVRARDERDNAAQRWLHAVEAEQRKLVLAAAAASEAVEISAWRASRGGEVGEAGEPATVLDVVAEADELTWLHDGLIGAIVLAGLVLGWLVFGRVRR
jgi:hypothetical protein